MAAQRPQAAGDRLARVDLVAHVRHAAQQLQVCPPGVGFRIALPIGGAARLWMAPLICKTYISISSPPFVAICGEMSPCHCQGLLPRGLAAPGPYARLRSPQRSASCRRCPAAGAVLDLQDVQCYMCTDIGLTSMLLPRFCRKWLPCLPASHKL